MRPTQKKHVLWSQQKKVPLLTDHVTSQITRQLPIISAHHRALSNPAPVSSRLAKTTACRALSRAGIRIRLLTLLNSPRIHKRTSSAEGFISVRPTSHV